MDQHPDLAVVFVHGVFSSPEAWSDFTRLLSSDSDLATVSLLQYGYTSPRVALHPLRRIPNFNDLADGLRTFLQTDAKRYRRLMIVAHSQGGLITQRYLARAYGTNCDELRRVRRVVMFACPNTGSELALSLRRAIPFWSHPQERELRPHAAAVVDAQRIVLEHVAARAQDPPEEGRIPIVAFAGETDGIVPPSSARNLFARGGVLPGDHSSIIRPTSVAHRSYLALKQQIQETLADSPDVPPRAPAPAPPTAGPVPVPRATPTPALTIETRGRLVDDILAVSGMFDPAFRDQIYSMLPTAIRQQQARQANARMDLFALMQTFDAFSTMRPWQEFLDALEALRPAEPAVSRLADTFSELGLVAPVDGGARTV